MPFLQFKGRSTVETYHYGLAHHTLEPDAGLSVLGEGAEPSLEGNLIIEGDNLLALKALLPSHTGRVKCVYIDPPYNTGNEGWVYNDNLTQPQFKEWVGQTVGKEGEDSCRHDKWCCMMYPRLHLLHTLLRDDGVIFVSIGDDEVGHLRVLMDELFDAANWLATFVWKKRSGANDAKDYVSVDHEYVIVYRKTSEFRFNGLLKDFSNYSNPDNDPRGEWAYDNLTCNKTAEERPNLFYDLTDPATGIVYPGNPNRVWVYEPGRMQRMIAEGKVLFSKSGKGTPQYKRHRSEVRSNTKPVSTWIEPGTTTAGDLQGEQEADEVAILQTGIYAQATKEVRQIFGTQVFNYPKPTQLVRELINQATQADSLVLDSFAGSGTTGQAVLELNREDGGHRTFILIQQRHDTKQDEIAGSNLCRTVTAERVKRVVKGYNGKAGLGGTFTYARVSEKPMFGEYRDISENLPHYEDLAKYIFFTETSSNWDPAQANRETGKIGEHAGASYYLLYTEDPKADWGMDLKFLKKVALHDPNKTLVVYYERFLMYRDYLKMWEEETGKRVRTMMVPFNLR